MQVHPDLYGDNKTRMMIMWHVNSKGAQRGCYNLLCKGFVQVDKSVPVDTILPHCVYDGLPTELGLKIHQDQPTKNWWVTILRFNINLGYWPGALFPGLTQGATKAGFYGYTQAPAKGMGSPPLSPPMGFGKFPDRNFGHSGYFANMQIINEDNKLVGLEDKSWKEFSDNPMCYRVKYYGYEGPVNGYVLEYGGPGGNCTP
ncbi:hypothetical protein AQUCO_01300508v1 [Aquilegia coerulea]|uniref:Neprosin PEP catalytic domain-containing protein n=1 Tax=Aquilegia coerulea TaxID=218851 RepID=A0A2G5E281_AQUCA|nr:hypothetical protein AQUCO_01300508v1 [Aquilegia coerulea]